ncbi:MAG: putative Ig domain-containing protein [Burkholderiales bacterium]
MNRSSRTLALACVATLVAGCGGVGQDTLEISVRYPSTPLNLFSPTTVQPILDGFDDHDAHCGLTSGQMAPGMRLTDDCTITGTPTTAGFYSFSFVITAEQAEGSVGSSSSITVRGPTVAYAVHTSPALALGQAVSDAPQVTGWTPPPSGATWSYQLASGALPPGITLNATTGVVSGNPTAAGSHVAQIQSTVTTAAGSYSPSVSAYVANVSP